MEQYNAFSVLLSDSEQITLACALDPTSQFWMQSGLHSPFSCPSTPGTKQDLVFMSLQKQRSCEEVELLQSEMLNTLDYFWVQGKRIEQKIQELLQSNQTDLTRGSISILSQQYAQNRCLLEHSVGAFKGIVAIPTDMLPVAHDPEPISANEDDIYYDSDQSSDADESET